MANVEIYNYIKPDFKCYGKVRVSLTFIKKVSWVRGGQTKLQGVKGYDL